MKFLVLLIFSLSSFSVMAKEGRFIVIFHPTIRADSVLLDTQTGRIWKDTCFKETDDGKCAVHAFSEQPVIGLSVSEKDFTKYLEGLEKK